MEKQKSHKHGGDPLDDFVRMGLTRREVIDFSVNLNPMGIPPIVAENWDNLMTEVRDYPDIDGNGITHFYSEKMGISPDKILAGNGSTELIYLIPRVFDFKRVLIVTPSFNDYERASILAGAEITRLRVMPENAFNLPGPDDLADDLADVEAIWLGRPNNPTANLFPKELILEMVAEFPEKTFIVDEAFIQFVDDWKKETLIYGTQYANLLVVHSLTKFYSVAGLRMGGVIGHQESIARLRKAKEPWTINGIADRVAFLLEQCEDYENKSVSFIKDERERIYSKLLEIKGISVFPSTANFFLCKWEKTDDLDDLMKDLLQRGYYIRDCRNIFGLEDNFFRFGIRSMKDNDRLISLLSSCPVETG